MNVLKKPVFAFILAVIVVIASSLISIDVKLSRRCDRISDGFYVGLTVKGERQPAPAECIRTMCADAEDMILKAANYGIDTQELNSLTTGLKQHISSRSEELNDLFEDFCLFYSGTLMLENQLKNAPLSDRHKTELSESFDEFEQMAKTLAASGYNDSVGKFLNSYDRFPARQFADLLDIEFPEYFA